MKLNPVFTCPSELNARAELFYDPQRPGHENEGPFLLVLDDFYSNPEEIRSLALSQEFYQFSPPLPEQVGEEIAAKEACLQPAWISSSLHTYFGKPVAKPHPGCRHAPPTVRRAIADIIRQDVDLETWDELGDWWNGAFHIQYERWNEERVVIHHHYKDGDVASYGWSGLVYLTPGAPPERGTTIWREKITGKCIASKGAKFELDVAKFDLALLVENRFNRLVLFRENVLHRAEAGFGDTPETGRMTQTFFFLPKLSDSGYRGPTRGSRSVAAYELFPREQVA